MSTNYGKQIAKNKGAVIAIFAVAFLTTYAVMNGGRTKGDDLSAAVAVSGTPTITSARVELEKAGNYLRISGAGFSPTNNLIVVCRVVTASSTCDSKPNTTMYLSSVKASTTSTSSELYKILPTKYSSGAPVVTSAKHRVYVLNNTTRKSSNSIILASLIPDSVSESQAVFDLISSSIKKNADNGSTTTIIARFNFKVSAIGGDVILGSFTSDYPMFGTSSPFLITYVEDTAERLPIPSYVKSYLVRIYPSSRPIDGVFTLPKGDSAQFEVTYVLTDKALNARGTSTSTKTFAIELEKIQWMTSQRVRKATTINWRTNTVMVNPGSEGQMWNLVSATLEKFIRSGSNTSTTTLIGKMTFDVEATQSPLCKPYAPDFGLVFASSTQSTYSLQNSISPTSIMVHSSPLRSSINTGRYRVIVTAELQSSLSKKVVAGDYFLLATSTTARVGNYCNYPWHSNNKRIISVALPSWRTPSISLSN